MEKQKTIIDEMDEFRTILIGFTVLRKKIIMGGKKLTSEEQETLASLFDEISIDAGKYGPLIKEMTGLDTVPTSAGPQDIWNWALSSQANTLVISALDNCISATSRTIGTLKKDIESGIRDEQGKVIEKPQRIDIITRLPEAAKDYGGRIVDKEFELTVQRTPDMILECIRSTVETLNSQGYTYSFRRTSGAPDYAKWDKTYFASCAISQGDEGQIGTIKLQLTADDKTILKTSQPDEWNSSYSIFLDSLFAEFQGLGFADSEKPAAIAEQLPKAFISHGKESVALRKLKEFLETLGIEPLIVKKQASLDKDLPDKVNLYLDQADFVIILATGDDTVTDKKTAKKVIQPRQNVIHEIGLAQKTHPGKIIYLLEKGVEFPSNIRPRVWESFKQRNMMDAFLGIVRELRAYGMLKIIKTPP